MSFDYPEKIRFKCLACGICCGDTKERTRHVLLLYEEAKSIAVSLNKTISDIASEVNGKRPYVYEMKKNESNGKCIFLKENRCTIYSKRPLICRFYPFGLEASQNEQKIFFFTTECPGIGKGMAIRKDYFRRLLGEAERRTVRQGR